MRSPCSLALIVVAVAACSDDLVGAAATGPATTGPGSTGPSSSTSGGGGSELPSSFPVEGVVVDENGLPVADAIVLQAGRSDEPTLTTGADGAFSLVIESFGTPTVVATKQGYRTGWFELYQLPSEALTITVNAVDPPDNSAYVYGEPGDGEAPSTLFCGHCHNQIADQFQSSKHARATDDPLVQDLYAGVSRAHTSASACASAGGIWRAGLAPGTTDSVDKCYLGDGVLPDLNPGCGGSGDLACDDPALPAGRKPSEFGACADCHAPAIEGALGGRNLHDAVGIAYDNGVHCDLCHHVAEVDLSEPPGVGGRLRVHRPSEMSQNPIMPLQQVMYGPLLDVPNSFMGGSLQPQFSQALFCAGCHEQLQPALVPGDGLDSDRWPDGLPVHSTFSEWEDGPYPDAGIQCQFCHMPANTSLYSSADLANYDNASVTYGFPRPPEQIRQHTFRSPLAGSPRLVDTALGVSVALEQQGSDLAATVTLGNQNCGHAIPTGEPMRALVLLVEASCDGIPLVANGGVTLIDVAGARATGVVGGDVTDNGTSLDWAAAAQLAQAGMVVRAVRPSGVYDDYPGVGFFADPSLAPEDKGLEILEPIGETVVTGTAGTMVSLASSLPLQAGDRVYLGDAGGAPSDAEAARALAGHAGAVFARVLVDAAGARQVPHHRAIDIASDNRIPPGAVSSSSHRFALEPGCTDAELRAWVIYRPVPVVQGETRGWDPKDYLVAAGSADIGIE